MPDERFYPLVQDMGEVLRIKYDENPNRDNYVEKVNARGAHAVLQRWVAEQDAKRWEAKPFSGETCWVVTRKHTSQHETFFRAGTPEQNKADAEEYAARLNAREGLS